ncbi:ACP S-malonyltransferase [Streptomyces violaceusniger]|uniref:Malonyl CoA-acyl carrier protein transacylase n=1 Tax=Streptomyces violaceusniger TaxID=68280 RepID=A0A4D4LFG8_STRVO|nr:polyketide biosynthesis malonyl CoA-acyl carrier protein transacylase PksC [Streptomyces violaceusniger]
MTVIHVFPGQGAHRVGMGKELFASYPHLVRQADAVLGYSIDELCLRGPESRLSDTRYTQCAMYTVGALAYIDRIRTTGELPDYVAGHSLGEYVALFAAGAFDFVTGVELVAKRAALMADVGPGAMAAVLGITADQVRAVLARDGGPQVDIANLNAPEQTVVSGPPEDIAAAVSLLKAETRGAVVPLKVSGAFHAWPMAPAAKEFERFLAGYRFAPLRIPVVSNATARLYEDAEIEALLVRQLTSPVRWTESVGFLLDQPEPEFHELGPGQVLTGLISEIRAKRPVPAGMAS